MREYGRVENSFWTKMHGVSDGAKLLAVYLKSCPHANPTGAYLLPDAYIADDLGWSLERVRETLSELLAKEFCSRFQDGRHIVVHGFIAAQPPENPNVVKSMVKHFERLPADPLLREVANQILALGHTWVPEAFRKGLENPSERVSETLSKESRKPPDNPSERVFLGLSKPRALSRTSTKPEPERGPEPDARGCAGVREAPAPLARVAEVSELTNGREDWAEKSGDHRWVTFKKSLSVRDWEVRFAPCRTNGSTEVLIVPNETSRKIIEHRHGVQLARIFGEKLVLKVEASTPKENRQ